MHGMLIVNPGSGDDEPSAAELQAAAEALGVRVHVLAKGDDCAEIARAADGPLGMAGGDGSLAAVAEVGLERDRPLVCIPFGTRNHFALDIGLDRDDPLGALAAFAGGVERLIDVGSVNDRLFLNNVSLGVYARLVLARLRALLLTMRERHGLHLVVDGDPVSVRVLLVANNSYDVELFSLGERPRLDGGELHLYTMEGWLPHGWNDRAGVSFTVEGASTLRTAIDGEPVELESPLRFEVRRQALRVLLPPGLEDGGDGLEGELVAAR
ncbi:MAG: diacylglycerol/lipid kinase family protein [Gaiellaceae bacterium]